jgi:branched-chain amino acid transport system substrate-binding protein
MMLAIRTTLLVCLLAVAGCVRRGEAEPATFGHFAPRGLPDRRGEHARQGVALAVEEALDGDKRIAGRSVTVLQVDGGEDAETIRAEATRLIAVNKAIALIAGPDPEAADHLVRSVEPYGIPVVVPCERAEDPPAGVVLVSPAPAERGQALARFASGELRVERAAVVTDSRSLVAAAVAAGYRSGSPRGEDRLNGGWTYQKDSNRQDLVQRVLRGSPGAVVIAGSAADFVSLLGQFRRAGFDKPVFYGGEDEGVTSLLRDAPAEASFYLATVYPGEVPGGDGFVQGYEKRFHEAPDLFAAQAYDATRLLLAALEQTNSAQPERLLEQLNRWEPFPTRTGPLTWKDRKARRPLYVVHVQDGKAKVVWTAEPEK